MENCLYVVKRDDEVEPYILVEPVYDLHGKQSSWKDQRGMGIPYYDDDVIVTKIIKNLYTF